MIQVHLTIFKRDELNFPGVAEKTADILDGVDTGIVFQNKVNCGGIIQIDIVCKGVSAA
jgi:hypothetical protein